MTIDWQSILALLIVAVAALWILRRLWKTARFATDRSMSSADCGGCSSCQTNTKQTPNVRAYPLVDIDVLVKTSNRPPTQ